MAINTKEYIHIIDKGLKANKTYDKFYYNFIIDNNRKRGLLNFSDKNWDKRTRVNQAKMEFVKLKTKTINTSLDFTENTTLNDLATIYYDLKPDTAWFNELRGIYKLYCSENIGKKKIKDIRMVHIDNLKKQMQTKGYSKQTLKGCSARTIKKVIMQIIKPLLQYAVDNRVLSEMPKIKLDLPKKEKKKVTNGSEKLSLLYETITTLYEDNPFYKTLFLFALYGRRWKEIRTLEWKDIDLINNRYTIRAENNKINEDQTYNLPNTIKSSLLDIADDKIGLVFKSPVTGKELSVPKKQLLKIKQLSGINELTMHYFRHILVSAMGEIGTATTVLSASLGHTNLNTVNQFYLSANHTKGSEVANNAISNIIDKI